MRRALLALLVLLVAAPAGAAEPQARAAFSRRRIMPMEEVRYTITLTADSLSRSLAIPQPDFSSFEVLGEAGVGTSRQVSIVNGQVTQSESRTYTWVLVPKQEGQLSVPEVTVDAGGGKTVRAGRVVIDVSAQMGGFTPAPQGGGPPQAPPFPQARPRARAERSRPAPQEPAAAPSVAVVAQVDDAEVWLGQEITLEHVLRYDVNVLTYSLRETPDFPGFANVPQDIDRPDGHPVRDPQTGRILRHEAVLARWSLVPLAAGTKEIPAQGYVITVQGDLFGFWGRQEEQLAASTQPVKVVVRQLPEGAPASFGGAVGSFRMAGELDASSVTVGDGLTLEITVDGAGSFQRVAPPTVVMPDGLKAFEPEVVEKAGLDPAGKTQGKKTFRYPVLVTKEGLHEIPVVEWSYFDPAAARYVTRQAGPFRIEAAPGEQGAVVEAGPLPAATSEVDAKGRDIRHPPPSLGHWEPDLAATGVPPWAWAVLAAGPLANLLLLGAGVAERMRSSDPGSRRAQGAARRARARLADARASMAKGASVEAADAVAKAVAGLVSDKLLLGAELAPAEAARALADAGAPALATEVAGLLSDCDVVRFAGGAAGSALPELVKRADALVGQLASARLARREAA